MQMRLEGERDARGLAALATRARGGDSLRIFYVLKEGGERESETPRGEREDLQRGCRRGERVITAEIVSALLKVRKTAIMKI